MTTADSSVATEKAQRTFSRSILISGIRCALTYVLLPLVLPFVGLAPGLGPTIGLIIGVIAIAANIYSIRRFWRVNHRWKVHVTFLHLAVISLLLVLLVLDVKALWG